MSPPDGVFESLRRERNALVVYLKHTAQTYEELAVLFGEYFLKAKNGMEKLVAEGRPANFEAAEHIENCVRYCALLNDNAKAVRKALDKMGEYFTPEEEEHGVDLPGAE